jgi:hypothetical protein
MVQDHNITVHISVLIVSVAMSCLFFFFGKANDDSDDENQSEDTQRGRAVSSPPKAGGAPESGCGSVEWKEDEWRGMYLVFLGWIGLVLVREWCSFGLRMSGVVV